MKKLFLFFAAMLVAVAVNAATINIDNSTPDALRTALNSAANNDFIVMAAGTYVESNNGYIAFDGKVVTVMAAEGAEVIIQPQVPITVSNGGHAIFEDVKIDASRLTELADWYEHLLYVTDGTPNGCTFRGCEFYGFNINKSMFYCNSANKLAMAEFENCYFHDIMKSILFVENTADKPMVSVKNCTFENISTNTESYWAGVIDLRAAEATLQVDHCTFYNVIPMNTDYSAVSKITLAKGTVSNCIFMLPTAQDGIRAMRGVTATNCITFNYLKDGGTGIHSSVTQNNCVQVDPAFVDPDNGNFTLSATSPALTMNDGQPIGDPRWVPVAPAPTTKTIYLNDGVWADADAARYEVYCITNESWVTLTAVADTNNIYSAEIPETVTQVVYCRMDPTKPEGEWSSLQNQTEDLTIPEGKDLYTITGWGEGWGAKCVGLWSKYGEEYVPTLANGFYLVGTFGGKEEWRLADLNESKKFAATEVEGEYTLNYTLAKGDLFKAVYVENDAIKTWYPEGTGNDYLVTEWTAGEKTIYFRPTYHEAWGGHFYIEANKPEVTYSDFEIVLYEGQLGTDKDNPNNAYLTVSGEQYTYSQEMPLAYNAYLTSANYNGAQHGYTNLVVTMPVEAGNYKVTLGTCQYGNGAGSIKKADDSETYKTFNQNIGEGKNYKTNPAEYIVSTVFSVAEAQMIKIVCGNYTPYIKVEQIANIEYAVTFAVEEGVRGIVPAPVAIVDGESLTIPANTTLYLDGKTLTGWTDGENTYAPGDVFTPEADATLTAVFAENTASLLTATVPVTVQWNFGLTEGAPTVAWEGENKGMGFLVAQATIGETKVDVPLDIDARSGKFNNTGRTDYWAQVNAGTKLYFPAKKGAEVEVFTYEDPATTMVDKATQTGTWTDNKSQFITTATIDASIMEVQDGRYYRYLKVTYPASEATAISNTEAEVKAQKVIENGQIFILKNGVKYNVLGASVK